MKLKKHIWLLMCMCAATFVWLSNASMAQQFYPQQNESLEIIPFRQSGGGTAFHAPYDRGPYQEGSTQRNFDPRAEAFGRREAYEYRRPYRAASQGEPIGPEAGGAYERDARQRGDGPRAGGSGHRGQGGSGRCQGNRGGQGLHARRRNESPEQRPYAPRPYDDQRYNEGADLAPRLSAFSPTDASQQLRIDPFAQGR